MRALVVDDSKAMRTILKKMVSECGYDEVHEAGDGSEALEVLEMLQGIGLPNVVLVDWNMPGMDGFDLVQHVRADPAYAGVRLMMVTTETEVARISAALEAGADEYLMKPFTKDVLLDKLELLTAPRA
ncbi:MAG: response regulator [Acidimicrobiia bacterium]|nr:response regulator [Acidimicrobiia bacterium]